VPYSPLGLPHFQVDEFYLLKFHFAASHLPTTAEIYDYDNMINSQFCGVMECITYHDK